MSPQTNNAAIEIASNQGLRVEFLTELAHLPPLAERWEALNLRESDHDAPFFQSFAWNYHVARTRLSSSPNHFRLMIATIWRDSDLVGVWPLSLQRSRGTWLARSLDDPFGQFAGLAFRDPADFTPGVAATLTGLRDKADGIHIEAVIAGSCLHAALLQHGAKVTSAQDAVVLDLRPFSSFEGLMQTIGSETRKTLRKRRSRLERTHKVEQVVETGAENLARLLKNTFDGRVEWLRRNGRTSPAFRVPEFRTVIDGLPQAEGIDLLGTTFKIERGWIALDWGFVYAGRYYNYMSAMDIDFGEFSPGRLNLALFLEECFRRGIKVVEFLAPALDYKLEWSQRTKKVETMSLPFNIKGKLSMGAASWAMSKARALSRMLPESLRKSLIHRLNRD
jgi:CelD/BcsL family acetyltransferase involved in cellulose biosynthesis